MKNKNENPVSGKRPPRFLLQMPDALRAEIQRAAYIHGRTITSEINLRLQASLEQPAATSPPMASEVPYGTKHKPTVVHTGEREADDLSAADAAMLRVFRSMSPEKQLALISLFK